MACWRESKEKWLGDGRSKLADASPLTTQKAGCTPLIAPALGPRRGDKPQCSLNPSHKDTYFQWTCKFSNGIVNFWNSSNSGRERLFDVLIFLYIEQGVAESHGARIVVVGSREGAHPIQDFFVFIHKTRGSEWLNRAYKRVSRESLWYPNVVFWAWHKAKTFLLVRTISWTSLLVLYIRADATTVWSILEPADRTNTREEGKDDGGEMMEFPNQLLLRGIFCECRCNGAMTTPPFLIKEIRRAPCHQPDPAQSRV